ncbi:hypothetical protein MKK84_32735 [Methylobacterium sp. E-065]|uniref:hypothetical protein n=1 Tax=Methylobacterium sp. E-065 TaxID=2836583 RepID=UPI001FBA84E2|nr:hypothetical protein [Methylobacterium sp. E-065]MCJ2022115.1 hypothetical protein [Methylobacterium sp. E-065]
MARQNNLYDLYINGPGSSGGALLSTMGSARLTQDGQVIIADRFSNRPVMVLDPAEFSGEYENKPDLILRDLNRMLSFYSIGRRIQLPSWCTDFE